MNTQTDTPKGTGSLDEAASAFEAILTRAEAPAPERKEDEDQVVEASQEESEALEAEDITDETSSEEAEGEVDEAADTEEEAPEEETSAEPLHTVKIDGKEAQVPLSELVKGYQRQSDYTRKSMAVAEERKALASNNEAVEQERAQYAELLTALSAQIEQELEQEPDWDALHRQNLPEYVRQREYFRDLKERRMAARSEADRVSALQEGERRRALSETLKTEQQKLFDAMPEWKADPKKFEADRAKIRDFGKKLGFTDDELANTFDHRAVRALALAMRYEQMTKNPPQAGQRRGPKAARPGAATQQPTPATRAIAAKKRLASSGSLSDAAAVFETLL